jgi:GNAT superfamily N-acetyltransferase
MQIREATLADREPIVGFDEVAKQDPERTGFIDRAVQSGACLVAEAEGRVVAYGVLEYTFFGHGFVSMLYVAPAARRCGVGRTLLNSLTSRCSTTKLFTSTNESNLPMRRLLDALGWAPSGVIYNLDVDDPELVYFFDRGGRTA